MYARYLEVSVHYSVLVTIFNRRTDLPEIFASFLFGKFSMFTDVSWTSEKKTFVFDELYI